MFDHLRSLAIFAKVAEVGSFNGAAKVLDLTPPVVSQHISQLEKELETALIYRSTRSLRLTDAGEKLVVYARKMLDAAETGIDEIIGDDKTPHGKLNIAAPGISNYEPFLDGITKYTELYPEVQLSISFDDNIRDLIREGFDLGIRSSNALTDSTLISRKLMENTQLLGCSAEYLKKHGAVKKPEDLQKLGFKWIGSITNKKVVILQRKDNPSIKIEIPIETSIVVNNYQASFNFGLRSLGLFSFSTLDDHEEVEQGLIVEPLPEWEFEPLGFYAVWPANAGARSLTRHFLHFMLSQISKMELSK